MRQAEIDAVRLAVAWSAEPAVACLRISGDDAFATMDRVCAADMFVRDGQVRPSVLLDEQGKVFADVYVGQDDEAYLLIAYLLEPEQMIERARIAGQFPSRPALYDSAELATALTVPPADALAVIERAVPRPVTPVYTQLSEILQVSVHRALTQQQEPRAALQDAAAAMRALLARVQLAPAAAEAR